MNHADYHRADGSIEMFQGTDLLAQSVDGGVIELSRLEPDGRRLTFAYVCLAPGERIDLRFVTSHSF